MHQYIDMKGNTSRMQQIRCFLERFVQEHKIAKIFEAAFNILGVN